MVVRRGNRVYQTDVISATTVTSDNLTIVTVNKLTILAGVFPAKPLKKSQVYSGLINLYDRTFASKHNVTIYTPATF